MILAQAAVSFRGVLSGQKVIGNGNNREEDERKDGQRHELHTTANRCRCDNPPPQAKNNQGNSEPGKVEEKFHSQG